MVTETRSGTGLTARPPFPFSPAEPNVVEGNYSVAGGYNNTASSFDSIALGMDAAANHANSFVCKARLEKLEEFVSRPLNQNKP